MTDDTIHFEEDDTSRLALDDWENDMRRREVTSPVITPEEARVGLDNLNNVQAATLIGARWDAWVSFKRKLVYIEYDGTKP